MNLWEPSTVGEAFYFFVHQHIGSRTTVRIQAVDGVSTVPVPFESASVPFTDWVGHTVTAQLIARTMRHTKTSFERKDSTTPDLVRRTIRSYARDRLGLSDAIIDTGRYAELAELAWEKCIRRDASAALKNAVYSAWVSDLCYLCGGKMSPDSDSKVHRTVDHLWPASLGGDTSEENLAPSCKQCNEHRSDVYGWPWGPVHRYFRRQQSIHGDRNKAWLWLPIHMREIMSKAIAENCSLKSAAQTVGPRVSWRSDDPDDVAHFFNLRTTDAVA